MWSILRGAMLGFTYCTAQAGLNPKPEIMVPVVSTVKELRLIVPRIKAAVADEINKAGVEVRIGW